jgi:hypothetical protein
VIGTDCRRLLVLHVSSDDQEHEQGGGDDYLIVELHQFWHVGSICHYPYRRQWRVAGQRSISPNTMSSEPMIAETSASMCPRLKKSIACRSGELVELQQVSPPRYTQVLANTEVQMRATRNSGQHAVEGVVHRGLLFRVERAT